MNVVKPKKHLGQHFLADENIASKIVESLTHDGYESVLEIGPGMGVLTKYLIQKPINFAVAEIDTESVEYLHINYPTLKIYEGDFLKMDLATTFEQKKVAIIGNFPYNISSQIYFKILESRNLIPESVGMIQKEVAERLASKHGNKTYGILSVLLQAFYDIEYLFTVGEKVFVPPPKVKSAVIRLRRNQRESLGVDEKLFFQVVKQGFNNRRKTLRNSLKPLGIKGDVLTNEVFDKRAEQLSVDDFIELTRLVQNNRG